MKNLRRELPTLMLKQQMRARRLPIESIRAEARRNTGHGKGDYRAGYCATDC